MQSFFQRQFKAIPYSGKAMPSYLVIKASFIELREKLIWIRFDEAPVSVFMKKKNIFIWYSLYDIAYMILAISEIAAKVRAWTCHWSLNLAWIKNIMKKKSFENKTHFNLTRCFTIWLFYTKMTLFSLTVKNHYMRKTKFQSYKMAK